MAIILDIPSNFPSSEVEIATGACKSNWVQFFLSANSNINHFLVIEPQAVHYKDLKALQG